MVLASPEWVKQCISNLLSNALKYSPSGTEVSLTLQKARGKLQVAVTDQGPGIKKEEVHKLFRQFSQLSTIQQDDDQQSTGLGLFLVQQMMEKMCGQVFLDFEYLKGAKFILEFNKL